MTRTQWVKEYLQLYGDTADDKKVRGAPTWMLELAVRYGQLSKIGGLRTETEFKMHNLTAILDTEGVKRRSDVWKYMVVRDAEEARVKHRKPEVTEPVDVTKMDKRPTASSIVLGLLREKPVRGDAQIIAAVNAGTFHDGFNKVQLAWYKNQFRKGRLKGQIEGEVITESAAVEGHSELMHPPKVKA